MAELTAQEHGARTPDISEDRKWSLSIKQKPPARDNSGTSGRLVSFANSWSQFPGLSCY